MADGFFPQRPLEGGWPATIEKMRDWREAAGKTWDFVRDGGADQRRHRHAGRLAADRRRVDGARRDPLLDQHDERRARRTRAHIQRLREVKEAIGQ